jgi:hypothetical protein
LRGNEGTFHVFNNYEVMVNFDLTTLIAIFSSRILELFGHYILDEIAK